MGTKFEYKVSGGATAGGGEQGGRLVIDNYGNFYAGASQAISGPGAVNLTTPLTVITTTGADAFTLADGADGQTKTVVMAVDGGDATLTPASFTGGTTLTFADIGDSVLLQFVGSAWYVVSTNGVAIA